MGPAMASSGRHAVPCILLLILALLCCLTASSAADSCAFNPESEATEEWEGEFFPGIPDVNYEGPTSRSKFAYRWYNPDEIILGRSMRDWLRFSVAFWHTFRGDGGDPFGSPTKKWPWEDGTDSMGMAKRRLRANFEFLQKLGVEFWCFHDRDIAPEGASLAESNRNLDEIVGLALELQQATGIKPLWGTAQLFKHPRYMNGAATNPDAAIFVYAAAQVKKAIDVTQRLGGENYVFWGGREGYQSLLNTDLKQELDHMAVFLKMAADYKKEIGFKGTLLLEPKPQEPTKHQYDWDAAISIGFLLKYNLSSEFKLNIECNHATLSGHSCEHELEVSRISGFLGSVDANTGDPQTGWDTDEFLTNPADATKVMLSVIRNGGLAPGGFNFDAKLRRESTDVEDLVLAHINGMDALARGLRSAAQIVVEGRLEELVRGRYASFEGGVGARIAKGEVGFKELEKMALESEEPKRASAKQELAESIFYSAV